MSEVIAEYSSIDPDRVRRATARKFNRRIDMDIAQSILRYQGASREEIHARIDELDREWDIERVLELNASVLALSGFTLGMTKDRRWLALPAAVMAFLLMHALRGWCPPLPLLRRLGIRTRSEIDSEKYGLKALLG